MSAVVVAGALANKPGSAGEAWVRMSWVRGLESIGCDVRFVEELEHDDPGAIDWFCAVTSEFGLAGRATLLSGGEAIVGPGLEELLDLAPESSLVNISGHLSTPKLFTAFRRRVMVDIDPGYTQFWHEAGLPGARVAGHDAHFTIGERIGTPGCPIPSAGVEWLPARQPVVLGDWPLAGAVEDERFTTVATWRGAFGAIERGGRRYGLKVHEFRRFIELPGRCPQRFEIALDIHPGDAADLATLRENGWRIVDPAEAVADPASFREYVRGSLAEFSVAQGVYVGTACGWFSDRTTRYLASGRPALVQDTGFGHALPVGEGLLSFSTFEEAVEGAADIVARYEEHSASARALAERHFAAEAVLPRFCERAGIR